MRRVLIVEDDLATLFVMRTLFSRDGWQVSQSRTIAGAMTQLDPPPDWVILDLGLADGDGADVLRHVRDGGVSCRVAIISGRLDDDRLAALEPLRADAVFQKPIHFEDLLKACGGADGHWGGPVAGSNCLVASAGVIRRFVHESAVSDPAILPRET